VALNLLTREQEAMSALHQHPNILKSYGVFSTETT